MNRIRTLLATAAVLAIVPFAAFALGDDNEDAEGVTLTMTSVHTLTAGDFSLSGSGSVGAFSEVTDFGTVVLTYSTNSVALDESSMITAIAVAWEKPIGSTAAVPVLKATASAFEGAGAGSAAGQVTLIDGANGATSQTLVTGITNGEGHTTTVTFAVDASDETIFAGEYSTTVTFTLTASGS